METETNSWGETREEAAEAISAALRFLQGEADGLGMLDVVALIKQARAKVDEHRLPH